MAKRCGWPDNKSPKFGRRGQCHTSFLVKAEGATDPVFAVQGLAGAVHGEEQVGAPAAGVAEAGIKIRDKAVEEIAEKGRPDSAATLRKGGLSDRSPAEKAKEVVQFDGGGLADQLQDESHGATKGQRAGANEVPVGLIDVQRTLCLGEVRKSAQQCQITVKGLGHSSKIESRLML